MKRSKKAIVGLAISALGTLCLGFGFAKPVEVSATTDTAWLENGASVRYLGEGNGLRFTMQIAESAFDENATYGILIAPEDYLTEGKELTVANVFGENAIYNWAVMTESGWQYTKEDGKKQIVNLVTSEFNSDKVNGVAVKEFYASLVDILEANIAREFRAVGYIRTGEEGAYAYEFVGDDDNVRSMAYVAQKAIEDTG